MIYDLTSKIGRPHPNFDTLIGIRPVLVDFSVNNASGGDVLIIAGCPDNHFVEMTSYRVIQGEGSIFTFHVGYRNISDPTTDLGFDQAMISSGNGETTGTTAGAKTGNEVGVFFNGDMATDSDFGIFMFPQNDASNAIIQVNIHLYSAVSALDPTVDLEGFLV